MSVVSLSDSSKNSAPACTVCETRSGLAGKAVSPSTPMSTRRKLCTSLGNCAGQRMGTW